MPIPNSYTEEELAVFMETTIGNMADFLHFIVTIPGSYDEAINNTLIAYGTNDISTITGFDNIALLRAYSKYYAWGLVAENVVNQIDYRHGDSQADYKDSQYYTHALSQQDKSRTELEKLGGDVSGIVVDKIAINYANDLYTATATTSGDEWSRIN